MFFTFFVSSLTALFLYGLLNGILSIDLFTGMLLSGPVIFLGTIMLTEPLTTPSSKKKQTIYGLLVGALAGFPFSIGSFYSTPEMALVLGNLFSFLISPRQRLTLKLFSKNMLVRDIYEFKFSSSRKISFKPGQYMEWTLPHTRSDTRGIRRYFSLASSPTEKEIVLAIKTPESLSTFKKKLLTFVPGDSLIATQIAGDFILPEDNHKKLVFIAGGIGITPFRSMIKYLIDTKEKRDITLFYINKTATEFIYHELLNKAYLEFGLKINYVITDKDHVPSNWPGLTGRIDGETITGAIPDWQTSIFYISGPNAMVNNYKSMLLSLGVQRKNIITDYFPGY